MPRYFHECNKHYLKTLVDFNNCIFFLTTQCIENATYHVWYFLILKSSKSKMKRRSKWISLKTKLLRTGKSPTENHRWNNCSKTRADHKKHFVSIFSLISILLKDGIYSFQNSLVWNHCLTKKDINEHDKVGCF